MIGGEFSRITHINKDRAFPHELMDVRRVEQNIAVRIARQRAEVGETCHLLAGKRTMLGKPLLQSADHEPAVDAERRELLAGLETAVAVIAIEDGALASEAERLLQKVREANHGRIGKHPGRGLGGLTHVEQHFISVEAALLFVQQRLHLFGRNASRRLHLVAVCRFFEIRIERPAVRRHCRTQDCGLEPGLALRLLP